MKRAHLLLPLFAAALGLATLSGGAAQEETTLDLHQRLLEAPLPPRDPLDVTRRFRPEALNAPSPTRPVPVPLGYEEEFRVVDQAQARVFTVRAPLRAIGDHSYWYVQNEYAAAVSQAALDQAVRNFETRTYPEVRRYFGQEPNPGLDSDPRIVFLLGNVPGVAAYFSGADSYPRGASPTSNERDIIFVNVLALRPGNDGFDFTMAHEFQHMVHFARCPYQETWVDEGAAQVASRVAGQGPSSSSGFSLRPDIQLTSWSSEDRDRALHYEASYLFISYIADRFGGWDAMADLFSTCGRSTAQFEGFLRRHEAPSFDDVFSDWTVANLVNNRNIAEGRFGYLADSVRVTTTDTLDHFATRLATVSQYAADYIEVPAGAEASFQGASTIPLVAALPSGAGAGWWSNRADGLDSRIVRHVDLSSVTSATATFRAWYDIEREFDFTYFVASTDNGRTWQAIPGRHTTSDGRVGNNLGAGWTGQSGGNRNSNPIWVDEEIDLTPFTGKQVLLGFEYLTDQGYSARGFAFDDFAIPQIGLLDESETDSPDGWQPNGWLRVDSAIPQTWQLRLVEWFPDRGPEITTVPVAEDGSASAITSLTATRSVLVIAPTADRTLERAPYQLTIK